jgi:hypothetical protein
MQESKYSLPDVVTRLKVLSPGFCLLIDVHEDLFYRLIGVVKINRDSPPLFHLSIFIEKHH